MTQSATLLMDLQADFLAPSGARMPVDAHDAARVIETANAILAGDVLSASLPIIVVNEFPRAAWVANIFRHGAAIAGTPGAMLDERVRIRPGIKVFPKRSPSAFSNPALEPYLKANAVTTLYIFGVFAEGCVRATAVDGKRHGYDVVVPLDAIGTNSEAKRRFAGWAMRRAGVELVPSFLPAAIAT
jgi:nicotinamidase-related amidase